MFAVLTLSLSCCLLFSLAICADDRLRPLSYSGTDLFLVCYSIISRNSFENVKNKWLPELKQFMEEHNEKKVPILLVGLKSDLRGDQDIMLQLAKQGASIMTVEDGERLAKESGKQNHLFVESTVALLQQCAHSFSAFAMLFSTGCATYVECSSKTGDGVKEVFDLTIRAALADIKARAKAEQKSRSFFSRWFACGAK